MIEVGYISLQKDGSGADLTLATLAAITAPRGVLALVGDVVYRQVDAPTGNNWQHAENMPRAYGSGGYGRPAEPRAYTKV